MSTSLKSFKNKPIKVKTSWKTLNHQVIMEQFIKEFPEKFDERKMFFNWIDSIETDIKVKGEKNVIGSF